jgi:signal transduction histidine kinase/CheY-like chemotaxis protein
MYVISTVYDIGALKDCLFVLVSILAWIYRRDLICTARFIDDLVNVQDKLRKKSRPNNTQTNPFCPMIKRSLTVLAGLARRLNWFEELQTEGYATVTAKDNATSEEPHSFEEACRQLLHSLSLQIACLEGVVIWNHGDEIHLQSTLNDSSRVMLIRKQLFVRLTSSSEASGIMRFGKEDYFEKLLALQGFAKGYWWRVASPDDEHSVFLWLGYANFVDQLDFERRQTEAAIARYSLNLKALSNLTTLESKVAREAAINERKGAFLSHFSHDIRTPINNIVAVVRLLQDNKNARENPNEFYDMIVSGCRRINQLVNEALDYSKAEAGELAPRPTVIDLLEAGIELKKAWLPVFHSKGLKFEVEFEDDLNVSCDANHFRRILDNVISNALKYTLQGEVIVHGYSSRQGRVVRIDISDTGLGFSKEDRERVFTPFERFGRDETEGVGLGLAVTRTLAQRNGGNILIQSELNSGTIVTIELPTGVLKSISDDIIEEHDGSGVIPNPINTEQKRLKSTATEEKHKHVVIIEDDADFRSLIAMTLHEAGFRISQVADMVAFEELISEDEPDVVVSDYEVPGGGAKECIKILEAYDINCPLGVMSGYDLSDRLDHKIKIFHKPFDLALLVVWLKEIFKPGLDTD